MYYTEVNFIVYQHFSKSKLSTFGRFYPTSDNYHVKFLFHPYLDHFHSNLSNNWTHLLLPELKYFSTEPNDARYSGILPVQKEYVHTFYK